MCLEILGVSIIVVHEIYTLVAKGQNLHPQANRLFFIHWSKLKDLLYIKEKRTLSALRKIKVCSYLVA